MVFAISIGCVVEALSLESSCRIHRLRIKLLQKLITHWHPDKVSKESQEDKKWYIVCEEITKKLTAKYEQFKC